MQGTAQDPNQQVNLFAISTLSTDFVRMPSRNATRDIDGVYYNPAGLTGLKDGFTLQVNNQFLNTTFNMLGYYENINESPSDYSFYPGSYIFPTIYGAFKRNRFVFSFGVFPAIGGGGGSAIANLPSAEYPVADATVISRGLIGLVQDAYGIDDTYDQFKYQYDFDSKGLSFSPGFQVGFSFKLNDYVSFSVAGRYLYYVVQQQGGLKNLEFVNEDQDVTLRPADYYNYVVQSEPGLSDPFSVSLPNPLPDIDLPFSGADILTLVGGLFADLLGDQEVNAIQSSSGITPIIGMNINFNDRWNIGLKYEHKTIINLVTKVKDGKDGAGLYADGKEVRSDLPGFFSAGVTFKPNDRWTIAAGHRLFFNKRANLNGREQYIKSLYKEFDMAVEYKVLPRFFISGGGTYRTVRYEDAYYTDVDYFLPGLTFSGGFKSPISRRVTLKFGFLSTFYIARTYYKDYEFFGGQLALVGIELPEPIAEALSQPLRYDVDGKAFVTSFGVDFWLGSLEQNREDREERIRGLKNKREQRRLDRNSD